MWLYLNYIFKCVNFRSAGNTVVEKIASVLLCQTKASPCRKAFPRSSVRPALLLLLLLLLLVLLIGMLLQTTVCICGEQGRFWKPVLVAWKPGLMLPPPCCSPDPPCKQTPPTLWHRKCPQSLTLPPSWVNGGPPRNVFTASDILEVLAAVAILGVLGDFCLGLMLLTCSRSLLQVTFFSGRPIRLLLSKFSCSTSIGLISMGTFVILAPLFCIFKFSLFMSSIIDASTRC